MAIARDILLSTKRARRCLGALSFACLALLVATTAARAQEVVLARAFQGPTFARVVFDWPAPVQYQARAGGNLLSIDFDRALTADLAPILDTLGGIILEARVGSDGQSVVLMMSDAFQIKTTTNGGSVIFDILTPGRTVAARPQASSSPPAAPPPRLQQAARSAPAATPSEAPPVRVRAGVHDTYSRVVFDWPSDVGYQVDKTGGTITVRFDKTATFRISQALAGGRLARIGAMSGGPSDGGASALLSVDEGSRVRHFRNGRSVVVDVLGGESQVAARPPQARNESPSPSTPPRREARQPPAVPVAPVEQRPAPQTPATADAHEGSDPGNLSLSLSLTEGVLSASFAWNAPVGAAFFERAGYAWAVFDAEGEVSIEPLAAGLGETVLLADTVPADGATAVRLRVAPDYFISAATRVGGTWRLDFRHTPGSPAAPVDLRREKSGGGTARVAVPLAEPGHHHTLRDPEVGDLIEVIPSTRAGAGVAAERAFAQFRVLASAQGVAVEPWSDDVSVSVEPAGVLVDAPQGLLLSADGLVDAPSPRTGIQVADASHGEGATGDGHAAADQTDDSHGADGDGEAHDGDDHGGVAASDDEDLVSVDMLLRYAAWGHGNADYYDTLGELNVAVSLAPQERWADAQWDLAKFYFAHGMAPETLSALRLLAARNPTVERDGAFKAIRGASNLAMGRTGEAAQDLLDPSFSADPSISLWRGAVYAEQGDWPSAAQEFAIGSSAIGEVRPPHRQAEFRLKAARAALEIEDLASVETELGGFETHSAATPERISEAKYVFGRARILAGDPEGGVAMLREVVNEGFRPTWANAQIALTDYLLDSEEIGPDRAVDNLERLKHVWRGGEFELHLLMRLKDLYLRNNDYRSALLTLRSIIDYFEDSTEADVAAEESEQIFRRLFLEGEADRLDAVAAVGLYNDFFELTPEGDDGQLMLRNLADRLVSVDLLGQAATIIDFQVNNRLRGADKARVAAKLAAIYLIDQQPQKALETLDKSRFRAIPGSLLRERRYLQARGLIDVQRFEEALGLLRQDDSTDAHRLRADIYWRTSDWPSAAKSFEAVLGSRHQDPAELSLPERQQVLQMTVAYALANDLESIAGVRGRYNQLMAGTDDETAFEVLTANPDRGSIGFRQVASRIAQLNTLDSFLERYRSDLREGGVGAIN